MQKIISLYKMIQDIKSCFKKLKLSLFLKQEKYLPAWYENNFNLIEL